jgi:uncharacterized membrane protein YqjE
MLDQETEVGSNGKYTSPISGLASTVSDFAGDFVELVELQVKLAKADAKAAGKRALVPILGVLVGLCILLSSLPVLALGAAVGIADIFNWPPWQVYLGLGAAMAILAVGVIYLSIRKVKSAAGQFKQSATQLANNVSWVKKNLRGSEY